MDLKTYLELSAATDLRDRSVVRNRLSDKNIDLMHACLGLQTESGEITDQLKKHLFYGQPLDRVHIKEELGDILWYMAVILRRLNLTFEEVAEANIAKLQFRYKGAFNEYSALNRDLDKEREAVSYTHLTLPTIYSV